METPVLVAIIGAFVSLGGIWLNHYLAIQREFLFRGVPAQRPAIRELQPPDQPRPVSVPVSRKTLLRDWRRALLAVAICPLVDLLVAFTIFYTTIPARGSALSVWKDFWQGFWDVFPLTGPWLYAVCIVGLFPLHILFYRRVAGKRARLIFAVLTWSMLSALYFFADINLRFPSFGETLALAIAGSIGGAISGLVYWLITYTSFPHRNADQII